VQLHRTALFESEIANVRRVRCGAQRSEAGSEEYDRQSSFIFPQRGVFLYHVGSQRSVADPNTAVIVRRDTPYRVAHPAEGGDECFVVRPSENILGATMRDACTGVEAIPLSSAQQRNVRLLFLALERAHDAFAQDEIVLTLLREISDLQPRRSEPLTNRKVVDEVRALFAAHPEKDVTLAQVGRRVHLSAYHLARLFQRTTGISMHQYRMQLRLGIAFDRMRAGWTDISALATELGFSHHSHFTAAFRKLYGITPSSLRDSWCPRRAALK
jgi:AraC family transcriptional regulator